MLQTTNLCVGYPTQPLLKDLNLKIIPKSLNVILGINGSGKTTLIHTLAGLKAPLMGTVRIASDETMKDIYSFTSKQRATHLTLLSQISASPALSVEVVVSQGRFPHKTYFSRATAKDTQIIEASLQKMGLQGMRNRPLNTLSGGEKQRVFLALALVQDTPLLLLDEPTTFLDMSRQLEIMQILKQLCNEGKTIIAVLHDINLALNYADRILLIHEGTIFADMPPTDLDLDQYLSEAFQVHIHRFKHENQIFTGFSSKKQ